MSNESEVSDHECLVAESCSAIKLLLHPKDKDLGDFTVRRSLPTAHQKMIGPWIFFDHMGPAEFPAGGGVNVRPHPHIGIATVTYLFEGEIFHRDSLGNAQAIRPGDINLMVAGKGIVHSEREREVVHDKIHKLHGLQLWIALPTEKEEIDPAFFHYPSVSIPTVDVDGTKIRVMMGSAYGVESPVATFSETVYFEADLKAGHKLTLPTIEEAGVYVASGQIKINDTQVQAHAMAVLNDNAADTEIEALEDARIVLVGGENIGRRFIEWNFVSCRKARIEQAKQDWTEGRFAKVLGDEDEFIPLP